VHVCVSVCVWCARVCLCVSVRGVIVCGARARVVCACVCNVRACACVLCVCVWCLCCVRACVRQVFITNVNQQTLSY
jgi:hypothetical protein